MKQNGVSVLDTGMANIAEKSVKKYLQDVGQTAVVAENSVLNYLQNIGQTVVVA